MMTKVPCAAARLAASSSLRRVKEVWAVRVVVAKNSVRVSVMKRIQKGV